tara:strand:- start:379 stop:912 length:534 start_codon:yes stop_codon:yes gene_type:complete
MLDQKNISIKMSKDINEMESMLNSYLHFAKSQVLEESTATNVNKLLKAIMEEKNSKNLHINFSDEVIFIAREKALKRCLNNIIENGLYYAKNVHVSVTKSLNRVNILVDDDGPGIPIDQYKNVFKPFYRLDDSRNLNHSGVGLGLSIAEDIVRSHGGNIELNKSDYNGLQVRVSLPL